MVSPIDDLTYKKEKKINHIKKTNTEQSAGKNNKTYDSTDPD
jgi:hypothetical protein